MGKFKTQEESPEAGTQDTTRVTEKEKQALNEGLKTAVANKAGGAGAKASAAKKMQQTMGNNRTSGMLDTQAASQLSAGKVTPGTSQTKKQRPDDKTKASPAPDHVQLLIFVGRNKLKEDAVKYGERKFPSDYHAVISRHLFETALKLSAGDYDKAFELLNDTFAADAENRFHEEYGEKVATGGINGVDKVKHFIKVAHYQAAYGTGVALNAAYAKELKDEIKFSAMIAQFSPFAHVKAYGETVKLLLGTHPTGWDDEDMLADYQGLFFALEMAEREKREQKEAQTGKKMSPSTRPIRRSVRKQTSKSPGIKPEVVHNGKTPANQSTAVKKNESDDKTSKQSDHKEKPVKNVEVSDPFTPIIYSGKDRKGKKK